MGDSPDAGADAGAGRSQDAGGAPADAGAPSSAAQSVQDPNASTAAQVSKAPPTPGQQQGGDSSFYSMAVPAETTVINLGVANSGIVPASPDPGIRMSTDTHAHLAVGGANHSLSLGTAAAAAIGGSPVLGLSFFTVAQKREEVGAAVNEVYHDTKTETITGPLLVTVTNAATWTYSNTLTTASKARTDTVDGDWVGTATGDIKITGKNVVITASGDHKETTQGNKESTTVGDEKWIKNGTKSEIVYGAMNDTKLGVYLDTKVGAYFDTKVVGYFDTKVGLFFETNLAIKKETGTLHKVEHATHMFTTLLRVAKVTSAEIKKAAVSYGEYVAFIVK